MTAILTYPRAGRGAWSATGVGGTLKADGTAPGRYFRSVASVNVLPVGTKGWQADRNSSEISINEYAVWRAALAIQSELRERGHTGADGKPLALDGVWGKNTDAAVKKFQEKWDIAPDGVYGPASSKTMWEPVVRRCGLEVDSAHATDLNRVLLGTINLESGWDPAAVGSRTPQDLGLGQINGPAHPTLSVEARLDPRRSLPYVAKFIDANLAWANYNLRLGVAAYNLGRTGASRWREASYPDIWPAGSTNNIAAYIEKVLDYA